MVSESSDDAEEELTGSVDANSSDLELMNDPANGQQMVGLGGLHHSISSGCGDHQCLRTVQCR